MLQGPTDTRILTLQQSHSHIPYLVREGLPFRPEVEAEVLQ